MRTIFVLCLVFSGLMVGHSQVDGKLLAYTNVKSDKVERSIMLPDPVDPLVIDWRKESGDYLYSAGNKLLIGFTMLVVGGGFAAAGGFVDNSTISTSIQVVGVGLGVIGTINLFSGAVNLRKGGDVIRNN